MTKPSTQSLKAAVDWQRPLDWASSPTLTTLRDAVGEETTRLIVQVWGGTILWVPVSPKAGSNLTAVIGADKCAAVIAALGAGLKVMIPTGIGFASAKRLDHTKIHQMYDNCASIRQIARANGCTMRQVKRILAKLPPKPSPQMDFDF